MWTDSHAHLTCDQLFEHVDAIIDRARVAKVEKIVNICTNVDELLRGIALRERYPSIYNVGSTTPHDVEKDGEAHFAAFAQAARARQLVAVGETGLDYFYEHSNREMQQEFLKRYFALATDCNLPVVIHCRDAFADLFKFADAHFKGKLLLHCFTGSEAEAKEALARGFLISISGIATFKRSTELRDVIKLIPLDQMVVETDAPYLAPQSKRGLVCESSYVVETGAMIAQIKGVEVDEVASVTTSNAVTFFNL